MFVWNYALRNVVLHVGRIVLVEIMVYLLFHFVMFWFINWQLSLICSLF